MTLLVCSQIADEFKDSFPKVNQTCYLHEIRIEESFLVDDENFKQKQIDDGLTIGFLSNKSFEKVKLSF